MVALKVTEAEAYIRQPNKAHSVILVYGPDAGLVSERVNALVSASVGNTDDPFSLVRIDGEDLTGNPLRLVEEANTIPLFGGKRALRVKVGGKNILPAVEALLGATSPDCRVVIEAGELRKNAPLRVICEKAKNAAAVPCYPDDEHGIARLLDEELRQARLTIAPDARVALMPFLGGDRVASRNEIRKLALYAHGRGQITIDDILAVVADASDLALDDVVDAAFAGRTADVELNFKKARASGVPPGSIILAALRQAAQLHKLRLAIDGGGSISSTLDYTRPPLHFRRRGIVEAALKIWTSARIERAMTQLSDALLEGRKQSDLIEAISNRVLINIAVNARRRE
jgi:DNA polymerase-3 subunit delta